MSNKDRVFIAVYNRPDGSKTSCYSGTSQPKPTRFQWGIWVEPKNSEGNGTSIDVEDDLSVPFLIYSTDSHFHVVDHKKLPEHMLGRLMVGKIPPERNVRDLSKLLRMIPLPSDPTSPIKDTVAWTKAAIEQMQDEGMAEAFPIDKFISDATSMAAGWVKGKGAPEKVNYTWSRTFP